MGLDELDAMYLAKMAVKAIREAGDTYPIKQLSKADYERFAGINLQGHALEKPKDEEDVLALYIIDTEDKLSKRFKVTSAISLLLSRGTSRIIYGTTNPSGKQMKVIVQWEKEMRVKAHDNP